MSLYILKRVGFAIMVLIGVLTITFVISRVLPSSPVELMLGAKPTAEQVARVSHELGLDRPLYEQYFRFVGEAVRGDFGVSFRTGRAVVDELRGRAAASIELVTLALLISIAVGVPLGIVLAVKRGRWQEYAIRVLTVTGGAVPTFFVGLFLQLIFYGALQWLPLNGRIGAQIMIDHPFPERTGFYLIDSAIGGDRTAFLSALSHLMLPLATLAISTIASIARVTGNLMIEVLETDYIRTARAYGLPPRSIYCKLALRPTLTSLLTVLGLTYGFLLGNSVFVEYVFDLPGLGGYVLSAVLENDFPAVMGVTLVLSTAYLAVNLLIDLLNFAVDPRLRPE